jgi:cell division protein FtsL
VKGFRLRNIVALFLLVLMGASVLMAHVWKQNAYVRLSKEGLKLTREHKALRDSLALLEMEAGDLRKLARIEGMAKQRFGLEYGIPAVPVYPEGAEGKEGVLARGNAVAEPKELETGKAAWPTRGL